MQEGVPLNTVREILGHRDIKMTLRYSHLAPNDLSNAVTALDRLFQEKSPQKSPQSASLLIDGLCKL